MAVVCFSSLKGGVGKTSAAVNTAHAFALRGCETVLVDVDPLQHASKLFSVLPRPSGPEAAAKIYCSANSFVDSQQLDRLVAMLCEDVQQVRPGLRVLPLAPSMGVLKSALKPAAVRQVISRLFEDLGEISDFVVVDTPPVLSGVVRGVINASQLVIVPIDSSAMSLAGLEELLERCSHGMQPRWAVLRVMVNRQALRVRALSEQHLQQAINTTGAGNGNIEAQPAEALLSAAGADTGVRAEESDHQEELSPVYLLDTIIYRTEQQNRLSFLKQTSFDSQASASLAGQYNGLSVEIEKVLALGEETDSAVGMDSYLGFAENE